MSIEKLTRGKKVTAVVCNQWGDSGKGKLVDWLAFQCYRIVVRGTGGGNAGHTMRVGEGPFPTELGGEKSAKWCSSHTRQDEEREYPNASMSDGDEFVQGIAVRKAGGSMELLPGGRGELDGLICLCLERR